MNLSGIEWTDTTWNPVTGCSKVSQGCKNCYAERIFARPYPGRDFTDVRCHPERLGQPLRMRKGRRIFVNSMSDLFHEAVPDDFILQVFDVIRQCQNGWTPHAGSDRGKLLPGHTFQILTKRPQRMLDFCTRLRFAQNDGRGLYLAGSLPHNGFNPLPALKKLWLGVSVEDQTTADERIPLLLQTPAAVRFISAEPLLGRISLLEWTGAEHNRRLIGAEKGLHLVIAGGESGPHARPSHPDWFRTLRDQCAATDVPFFFKQWGEWMPFAPIFDDDPVWPYDLNRIAEASEQRSVIVDPIGGENDSDDEPPTRSVMAERVGKKAAGRTLDGREHNELPA